MIDAGELRNGSRIELDGEAYIVVDAQHVKPGKGGAFCRTKLKNLRTGLVIERTFRVGEKLQEPDLEEQAVQFLYKDGDQYCFMDMNSYEQIFLTEEDVGEARNYLKENMELEILFHKGQAIGIELPLFVELQVVDTEPPVRGDTAAGGSKPAVLETGAVVKVPLYLQTGETIRVDTRTGEFIERVKGT